MKTLIIGGGLSGLSLADALEAKGHDYMLVEARNRFGGRIMTEHHGAGYFDMGPAWFWPGQPRIAALIDRLGLEKFDQFADGILTFEDERGQVQRGRGFSSMQGSWRVKGGLGALPPRLAAEITYTPALPKNAVSVMQGIATWMAGQAKAVAVYDTPFWRDEGLSGDAQSRVGPMVEVHDASPAQGGPYALFGFIGIPPQGRADEQIFRQHLRDQLIRLFGPKAGEPAQLYVKDWAFDPQTSTMADQAPLYAHPTYGLPQVLTQLWDDTLHFGGTEVAAQFGGYVEGALEAAENVLRTLDT